MHISAWLAVATSRSGSSSSGVTHILLKQLPAVQFALISLWAFRVCIKTVSYMFPATEISLKMVVSIWWKEVEEMKILE